MAIYKPPSYCRFRALLQVSKGAGDHGEDDAMIANIRFGGPKVRRLSESDDSSGGLDTTLQEEAGAKHSSKGTKGKGEKMMASNSSVAEGTHKFQSIRKSGALLPSTEDVRVESAGAEDVGAAGNRTAADAPGSLLVSGIEAQARREAEKAKAAAAGSAGTKIVAKKKKRDTGGGGATAEGGKKRKKHKSKEKPGGGSKKYEGGAVAQAPTAAAAPATAGAGAGGLGMLNLLGSYASSSGSDGD